jgi:hypothetical protein
MEPQSLFLERAPSFPMDAPSQLCLGGVSMGLAKRFRIALVGSQSDRVFHLMRMGGKNGLPLPILIDPFHHPDHRQEHQQNYDDRHNLLPLQK